MNINNFNAIYQLFAALSSAVFGLESVKEYTISKIERAFSRLFQILENVMTIIEENNDLLNKILDDTELFKSFTEKEIKKLSDNMDRFHEYEKECQSISSAFSKEKEEAKFGKQYRIISLYLFLYYFFILVVGGFESDITVKTITTQFDFCCVFLQYFTILTIGLSLPLLVLKHEYYNTMSVIFILLAFAIAIILTYFFNNLYFESYVYKIIIIGISFLIFPVYIFAIPAIKITLWTKRIIPEYKKILQDIHNYNEINSIYNIYLSHRLKKSTKST